MATLQVKGMDDELYRALGARAKMDHRSVSQEVVMIIKDFLGRPVSPTAAAGRSLLALGGAWEDEQSPEVIARQLRKSRRHRHSDKNHDVFT